MSLTWTPTPKIGFLLTCLIYGYGWNFFVSDLAEDPDVKQKILDLKDELESHRASKSKDGHIKGHRRSVNPRRWVIVCNQLGIRSVEIYKLWKFLKIYEPHHEKTCLHHMQLIKVQIHAI